MAVNDCISLVQAAAKDGCLKHRGELEKSIHTMTGREDNGVVRATCYTDLKYAPYVEFGTGPVGQERHPGIAPGIPVAYSQKGWMIPGKAMSRYDAEEYGLGYNLVAGASIAAFLRVADAMMAQGIF